MVWRRIAFITGLIMAAAIPALLAQPLLPNLSASADKGVVLLSWTAQYDGIKSIAVLHSTDSMGSYSTTGYVQKLAKGVQAYVDGHADTGRNYYKLTVLFSSGLKWTTNRKMVYIDVAALAGGRLALPRNDSLQKFLITEERYHPAPVKVGAYEAKPDSEAGARKISLSFEADSADLGNKNKGPQPAVRKKLVISFDEPDETEALYIRSLYINRDAVTGHIDLELPDDVRKHVYTVQFYDQAGHMALELPKINDHNIIIEKRNFPHRGIMKFVLKKDGVVLEQGSVAVE